MPRQFPPRNTGPPLGRLWAAVIFRGMNRIVFKTGGIRVGGLIHHGAPGRAHFARFFSTMHTPFTSDLCTMAGDTIFSTTFSPGKAAIASLLIRVFFRESRCAGCFLPRKDPAGDTFHTRTDASDHRFRQQKKVALYGHNQC